MGRVTVTLIGLGALVLASCGSAGIETSATARDATLGVRADGCGPRLGFGTATLIDDELALTAAHVVAGATDVTVIGPDGVDHRGDVVWFDPEQDVAAVRVEAGIAAPVQLLDEAVAAGDTGTVGLERDADVRADRTLVAQDVEVVRRVNVATTDIYLDAEVIRPGFEISATIEPGDSGSLVLIDGAAAGVVWARSTQRTGRAWVVEIPPVLRNPATRGALTEPVNVGPCTR
ncbi:MAG: trypsin-like peptidase domain-containing protein [Ilumatobacter sp.]